MAELYSKLLHQQLGPYPIYTTTTRNETIDDKETPNTVSSDHASLDPQPETHAFVTGSNILYHSDYPERPPGDHSGKSVCLVTDEARSKTGSDTFWPIHPVTLDKIFETVKLASKNANLKR